MHIDLWSMRFRFEKKNKKEVKSFGHGQSTANVGHKRVRDLAIRLETRGNCCEGKSWQLTIKKMP